MLTNLGPNNVTRGKPFIIRSGADNNVIMTWGNFDGATLKVVCVPLGEKDQSIEFDLLPDPATFTAKGSVFIAGYRNIPLVAYLENPTANTNVWLAVSGMG